MFSAGWCLLWKSTTITAMARGMLILKRPKNYYCLKLKHSKFDTVFSCHILLSPPLSLSILNSIFSFADVWLDSSITISFACAIYLAMIFDMYSDWSGGVEWMCVLIKGQPKKLFVHQINAFESFQIDWIDELIRRFQLNFMSEIHSYGEWNWLQSSFCFLKICLNRNEGECWRASMSSSRNTNKIFLRQIIRCDSNSKTILFGVNEQSRCHTHIKRLYLITYHWIQHLT